MQTQKSNLTIRIEPQLKEEASTLFRSLGLDLSTATGIFYRQALRCHGLPFEVKLDEPNEITYKAMDDAENGRADGGSRCLSRNSLVSSRRITNSP